MQRECNKTYQGAAAVDVIIASGPAILERIIIGADVGSGVLEISDSVDDGDGNVVIKIASSTMMADTGGYIEVGAKFKNGIAVDMTLQTDCTFIWRETIL